jgi:hypothetical protein
MMKFLAAFILLLSLPLFADDIIDDITGNLKPIIEGESPEDDDEYWDEYQGPIVDVLHDNRTNSDYIRVEVPDVSITEYHYLKNINYADLVFVLTDLLRRITNSGYRYCSEITTTYAANEEVAIIYFEDLVNKTATGELRFPDFSMGIAGSKTPSAVYRNDIGTASTLQNMIIKFIIALSQVEMTKGYSMEYLMQFFKQAGE